MKNPQQKLLAALALGLCILCAWQWNTQVGQRGTILKLNRMVDEKNGAIQEYTNSIKIMDRQIAQLDQRITELRGTIKTNEFIAQEREAARQEAQNEKLKNIAAQYNANLAAAETRLKEAFDGIARQNDAVKELVSQRDDFVRKYNDSVKERNEIVEKYNDLVRRFEQLQAAKAPPK